MVRPIRIFVFVFGVPPASVPPNRVSPRNDLYVRVAEQIHEQIHGD